MSVSYTHLDVYKRQVLNGEGLICQETPDDDAIKQCEELGEQLAQNA